jgi:radical SAM superfamily enzyme YgiQ (UPF0313 family)
MIGFSTTWWPYRKPGSKSQSLITELRKFGIVDSEQHYSKDGFVYDVATGNVDKWINEAKAINPKIKIVVGGPKIDFYRDIPADHFIVGIGESEILDLLTDKKRLWPTFIDHDTNGFNKNWDWQNSYTDYTDYALIKNKELLTLETSRGCRFKCSFCSYPLIGQKNTLDLMKSKETLYTELKNNYDRWGTVDYWITDDTFNDSTEKLKYLLDVTRKLEFRLRLRAYVRLDIAVVHPEQIDILHELGLAVTWIGVDSFHPIASKAIGKGMGSDRRKNTLIKMREVWGDDVRIEAGYIVGLPGEGSEHAEEAANWFASPDSPVDQAHFNPLRIIPTGILPYMNRSEIDKDYKKFGYDIPNLNTFWYWTKNDDTDIKDFDDANKLADRLNLITANKPTHRNNTDYTGSITDPITEYFLPLVELLQTNVDFSNTRN